jgi:hypothetical protein
MGIWAKRKKDVPEIKKSPLIDTSKKIEIPVPVKQDSKRNYYENSEKIRVKYGKEKRLWDLINIFLIMILFIWLLVFLIYYFLGKIQ